MRAEPSLAADIGEVSRRLIAEDLLAAYLVGSIAQADARPTSDLDVMVIARQRSERPWLTDLAEAVAELAERGDVPRTEYVVYAEDAVARPRHPLPYLLNVNAGPDVVRSVSEEGAPAHWFLLDVAMARHHAVVLHGPPAHRVLGETPVPDVARAVLDAMEWHTANDERGVDTVLNACRGWRYLMGGGWASKTAAGRWAAARWAGDAIHTALRARETGEDITVDPGEVTALLEQVSAVARERVR